MLNNVSNYHYSWSSVVESGQEVMSSGSWIQLASRAEGGNNFSVWGKVLAKMGMNRSHEQQLVRTTKDFCSLVSIQISVGSFLGNNKSIRDLGGRERKEEKVRKVLLKY